MVRFTKNQAAALKILLTHNGTAILQGVAQTALPKGFIKFIVGIGGNNAHPNLGFVIDKARAQIFPLVGNHIHQITVGIAAFNLSYFFAKHPGMSVSSGSFSLGGNKKFSKLAHKLTSFIFKIATATKAH